MVRSFFAPANPCRLDSFVNNIFSGDSYGHQELEILKHGGVVVGLSMFFLVFFGGSGKGS